MELYQEDEMFLIFLQRSHLVLLQVNRTSFGEMTLFSRAMQFAWTPVRRCFNLPVVQVNQ